MATAVNSAVAYLVTLFGTATGKTVYDGPRPASTAGTDFLLVGSAGDDDDAISVNQELAGLGPGSWQQESGEIVCSAWVLSGSTDLATSRAAAVADYEACRAAVGADRHLGGLLVAEALAQVSGLRLSQRQTKDGVIVRALFSVNYTTTLTA
jgi:hypothetical protein